jgi:hypothetical protein
MMSTPVSINASQASGGAIYSVNTKRKGAFTSFNLLQLYEHPLNHLFLPMDAAYPLFLFALSLSLSLSLYLSLSLVNRVSAILLLFFFERVRPSAFEYTF